MKQAEQGISEMRKNVDTMIVVPNERLLAVVGKGIPFQDALKKADEVLHATQGIASLITSTGIINVDFADVWAPSCRTAGPPSWAPASAGATTARSRRPSRRSPAAAGQRLHRRRHRGAHQHHRRRRPHPGRDHPDQRHHPRRGGRRRDHLRGRERPRHARRGPGHGDRHRVRPRLPVEHQPAVRPSAGHGPGRHPELPDHAGPAVGAGAPAPAAQPITRPQPRAPQAPPAAGPPAETPEMESRPSSAGRWTDALAGGRRVLRHVRGRRRDGGSTTAVGQGGASRGPADRRGGRQFHRGARHPPEGRDPLRAPGQGVLDLDVSRLDVAALDPRLRAGLVFSFRRPAAESLPDRISVRASPEQRVVFRRAMNGWESAVDSIQWRPSRSGSRATSSTRSTRPSTRRWRRPAGRRPAAAAGLGPGRHLRLAGGLHPRHPGRRQVPRGARPPDLRGRRGAVRRVLASDLTMSGKSLTAFRFDSGPRSTFYDEDGKSLRRAFLRAPVQFRRISSSFARTRRHPVLGITRRHQGTDYAASPGTPVMAAGDGVVLRAGRTGLRQPDRAAAPNGITTRYGHLRGSPAGSGRRARHPGPDHRIRRLNRPRERAPLHYEFG